MKTRVQACSEVCIYSRAEPVFNAGVKALCGSFWGHKPTVLEFQTEAMCKQFFFSSTWEMGAWRWDGNSLDLIRQS